ncbi:hypothetical protein TELCIR_07874 [Teladorsagia circumcincta]|uniref:Uncharacterized protein n=1 Tax=Teladorsagia circumcincta TaxID=45464 RepID=A0A2G9UJ55_TELCI|nr:hypothetical protein TELCIR_08620 [Teladorsagia circumcincta]PIO70275.1 hypothetical protein TELCIR_07874 [Teladorsagia circumcincta]
MLLLGVCTAYARPSKDFEMMVPANYRPLNDALQRNVDFEQEILRRYYDRPLSRLQREVNTFQLPDKRIPRIGGTIVMGRKK